MKMKIKKIKTIIEKRLIGYPKYFANLTKLT